AHEPALRARHRGPTLAVGVGMAPTAVEVHHHRAQSEPPRSGGLVVVSVAVARHAQHLHARTARDRRARLLRGFFGSDFGLLSLARGASPAAIFVAGVGDDELLTRLDGR